jgi:hypothetical protein
MPEYEERYVGFVDILGFRDLLNKLARGTIPHTLIHGMLKKVHEPQQLLAISIPDSSLRVVGDLKALSISDAVAISTHADAEGLNTIFDSICELATGLAEQGYLVRGGLTRGMLYQDDKTVFGQALVSAYQMESQIARYPRVLVPKSVHENIISFRGSDPKWNDAFEGIIKRSDDGPLFLNILRPTLAKLQYGGADQTLVAEKGRARDRLKKIGGAIQHQFDESIDDPKVFEKYQWFSRYFNETVPTEYAEQIRGPGVEPRAFQ